MNKKFGLILLASASFITGLGVGKQPLYDLGIPRERSFQNASAAVAGCQFAISQSLPAGSFRVLDEDRLAIGDRLLACNVQVEELDADGNNPSDNFLEYSFLITFVEGGYLFDHVSRDKMLSVADSLAVRTATLN